MHTEVLRETPDNDFVFILHQQVLQLGGHSDWTMESLSTWLDQHIEHQDIPADESGAFLRAINFKTMSYEPSWVYEGGFQFKKHYFGPKPGELAEKTAAGKLTEEFQCAQFIDGLSEVEFWVRNLARKSTSFRLHTSKDWFYPDFLCKLVDGRVLAVEYKGKHLWTDAEDKRVIGAVWASRSKGGCLFVMPTDGDFSVLSQAVKTIV